MKIEEILLQLKSEVLAQYEAKGLKASGNFARKFEVIKKSDTHYQVLAPYYVYTFEHGRKPGKVPQGFASIIYKWSEDKGISFANDKQRSRFAFAVAKKISKFGTSQYLNNTNKGQIYTPAINKAIDEIQEQFKDELMTKVNTIFKEWNKL